MMAYLSNKVTMLERAPRISSVPVSASAAVPLLDPETFTGKPGLSQTVVIEETVRKWVEQRLHQLHLLEANSSQEDSSSEKEPVIKKKKNKNKKKAIKTGRDRTGTTSVKKRITWPHEVIYVADSHPATRPPGYIQRTYHQLVCEGVPHGAQRCAGQTGAEPHGPPLG